MQFVHCADLIGAIAEALLDHDIAIGNDAEPWDYYTEKARVAATAYDEYQIRPRQKPDYIEGLPYYRGVEYR